MKRNVIHSTDFVTQAVDLIQEQAEIAIATRGRFILALSGGNTPKPVYELLATRPCAWEKWVITFGDERCVPPDDERSNFRMAKLSLFDHVPIPRENILRMKGELKPAEGALDYQKQIQSHFKNEAVPSIDLVLLGMGPDGHTASLFPGTSALQERSRLVIENYVPQFSMWRITFTYPLLNAARHICFLVSKKGKEAVLEQVLAGQGDYPCVHVKPNNGDVTWLLG